MGIALISPSGFYRHYFSMPMGLAYIGAVLDREGFPVQIVDMGATNLQLPDLQHFLSKNRPDIVGITSITPTFPVAIDIAKIVKKILPETTVIMGGKHVTFLPEEALSTGWVDVVVKGEGEMTMLELVQKMANDEGINGVLGISYRENEGIIHNRPRPLIKDLDALPFPARHLLPMDMYRDGIPPVPYTILLTSRGCRGHCIFCTSWRVFGCTRLRSPENVVAEIEHVLKKYHIEYFGIWDDDFTADMDRVIEICDLILKRGIKIHWNLPNGVRADRANLTLFKKMKEAGCFAIDFGVETGSQEILAKIGKGITMDQVENAVKISKAAGLNVGCFFIIGNIGEDEKTIRQTIEFAKKLRPHHILFSIATPFPGTLMYEIVRKEGRLLSSNWSEYGLHNGRAVFEHGKLTRDLIERMYREARWQYFMHPSYLLQIVKRFSSSPTPRELGGILTGTVYTAKTLLKESLK